MNRNIHKLTDSTECIPSNGYYHGNGIKWRTTLMKYCMEGADVALSSRSAVVAVAWSGGLADSVRFVLSTTPTH